MPRPLRIDYHNAWHHVMNRGAARASIFQTNDDRACFLDCLAAAGSKTEIEIHGYCLMGNHFHLLVRSQAGRLSDFLRNLTGRYVHDYNRRWRSDGPLFRGRSSSIVLATDAHLLMASRYIHLNPVAAGLVDDAAKWPWSSAAAFMAYSSPPPWLVTSEILAMFTSNSAAEDYAEFLREGVDAKTASIYQNHRWD